MELYLGIDNGVSGSIGYVTKDQSGAGQILMPVKSERRWTKKESYSRRIDWVEAEKLIKVLMMKYGSHPDETFVLCERPMVNPQMFFASMSALRAHESIIIVLEMIGLSRRYIDSREWQRYLMPRIRGKEDLKKNSILVAQQLFPVFEFDNRCEDADGLLIAEYARLEYYNIKPMEEA